jgi:hypothetical protein
MVAAGKIDGLENVLAEYGTIRVADYQRNYDWTSQEIDDLWRDLRSAIDDGKEHFFGSLIVQQDGEVGRCELVDGQQRITTIFLFIARLRDEVQKLGLDSIPSQSAKERNIPVRQYIEDFLYGKGVSHTEPRYQANALLFKMNKDALSPADDPDSERGVPKRSRDIDKEATLAYRKAFWQVRRLISVELEDLSTNDLKLRRLHSLSVGFRNKLRVLPITTGDLDESLNVFMTINDRGLPLGVFDLVRGQVLKAITANKDDHKKKTLFVDTLSDWESILSNIEGVKPDQYLRHYLLSTRAEKVTMKSVPIVAAKIIDMASKGFESRAESFWQGIQESSELYDTLLRPTMSGKTKQRLECLRMIADSYRVLGLRILHSDGNLSQVQQDELVRLLFIAVMRWNIEGRNAQELEGLLQEACKPLWQEGGFSSVETTLQQIINLECDIPKFLQEGVSVQWAKAILLTLETELSGKAASLNISTLHVEHVAPQKSTDHWKSVFAGSDRSYKELVEDIGNLTILDSGLNQAVKQKPFVDKAIEYKKSRSNVTNNLEKLTVWDDKLISERHLWIERSLATVLSIKPNEITLFSE